VKAQELSQKYAKAVFSLDLDEWITTLDNVQNGLASDSALLEKLQDSSLAFKEKQAALNRVLPGNIAQPMRNFLYMLLREGDIGLLTDVLADIERMSRGGPDVQVTYVTTATELSEEEKTGFQQKLRTKYGDGLEFVFYVDPAIVGGAIVQVGDKLIDGSVATRLNAISSALGVKV
jgi:F-type H+-transporting ATPase subunit delta